MKNIRIMTDSASDIPVEIEKELNIKILSFPVAIDNESYFERIDFTPTEFYKMLENAKALPVTSQITPLRFYDEFLRQYKKGYKDVVYVSIASKGSGSNAAAILAREMLFTDKPELSNEFNIHIIDSKSYSLGYGHAVIQAAKKAQKGSTIGEILAYLYDWFDSVEIYFAPYTLEYAKKSGRINVMAAFIGELMGIRPILSIIDGNIEIASKVRGDKNIIPALLEFTHKRRLPQTQYCLVKSLLLDEATEFENRLNKDLDMKSELSTEIGAAIAINAGPRVIGIILKGENRNLSDK